MAFTKEKLAYLRDTKAAIKNALIEKGQSVTDADTFRSYADKVLAISGSANVCTVTFIGADGEELFVKDCVIGDDSYDPVATGALATPTKASTVYEKFTYSGWSLTEGGAVNSAALKSVTSDRTVYAVFEASTIYYTVNFYDGTTLIESKGFAYGETPTVAIPSKSGYSFIGWSPTISPVTGSANYYAQWKEQTTFAGGSWADIAAISESGEAANYFKIGDTRDLILTDGNKIKLRIVGFNHDKDASGTPVGMTIACTSLYPNLMPTWASDGSAYNTTSAWYGDETKCALSNALAKDGEVWNTLESALKPHIKPVLKEYDGTRSQGEQVPVTDSFYLWAFSVEELNIPHTVATKYQTPLGTAYAGFAEGEMKSVALYGQHVQSQSKEYWTRSADRNSGYFSPIYMRWSGQSHIAGSSFKTETHYLVFGFCI